MQRLSVFLDINSPYCQDASSFHISLWAQYNLNQNPSKLFCGYQETDFKVSVENQKTPNSRHDIE